MKSTNKESLINWSLYDIYEDGRIYSKYFKRFLKGHIENHGGYVTVLLACIDGKQRIILWHRAIWYAFNGEIPEDLQVNHIDENKQNNALSNLNLMTPKENVNWGTRNERSATKQRGKPNYKLRGRKLSEEHKAKLRGKVISEETKRKISEKMRGIPKTIETKAKMKNNPLRSKQVVAVKDGVVVMEFQSTQEAGRNGFCQACVAACCRGEYYGKGNRFFKGYYWYFKSDWEEKQNAVPHKRETA